MANKIGLHPLPDSELSVSYWMLLRVGATLVCGISKVTASPLKECIEQEKSARDCHCDTFE